MDFNQALKHTLTFEGGYANVPGDRGGETFRGISRTNWPGWGGWPLIDEAKRKGKTTAKAIDAYFAKNAEMEKLVAEFYFKEFWLPLEALKLPPNPYAKVFDTGVNVGLGRVKKFVQSVLNDMGAKLHVDGKIGRATIAAVKELVTEYGEKFDGRFLDAFVIRQSDYYKAIVKRDRSQEKFLEGWLRRAKWRPA